MTVRPVEAGSAPEVDQAVRGAQDKLLALARVAQVTGDPAGPMLEALAAQLDAEHRLFDDLKQTLAEVRRPEAVFTDNQVDDIGRRLLSSCQTWLRSLVRAALWKSWTALAATVLIAIVAGGVVSWLAFGRGFRRRLRQRDDGRHPTMHHPAQLQRRLGPHCGYAGVGRRAHSSRRTRFLVPLHRRQPQLGAMGDRGRPYSDRSILRLALGPRL